MQGVKSVHISIYGNPAPKGSVSAFVVGKGENPRAVVSHTEKSKNWEKFIKDHLPDNILLDGPLYVSLRFYLERKESVKRELPYKDADLDKLVRAVLDAIQVHRKKKGIIINDSRVTDLYVTKRYADETRELGVDIDVYVI